MMVFHYAELVCRVMRAVQNLSLKDTEGVDAAVRYLEDGFVDDDEVHEDLARLCAEVSAARDSDAVERCLSSLCLFGEKIAGRLTARCQDPGPQFEIRDDDDYACLANDI